MKPDHILMQNFYAPGRGYFERAVLPTLEATQRVIVPTVKKYIIAGKHIHISIYGDAGLHVFLHAFDHQDTSHSEKPDLVIHAWDSEAIGTDPTAPWDDSDYHAAATPDPTFLSAYVNGEESLSFFDATTKTGYFWMHDTSQLADWSTGAPFRAILHWFLGTHTINLLHGAVVGRNNTSVLLTAPSGSGKSTTALSSILAGMDYVGDDYVAVETHDNEVIAHSLYNSAKITRGGLELFPELKPLVWNKDFSGSEKAVVFMSHLAPDQVKTSTLLNAVLIPRITGGETKIIPASKIQVLVALAPTTLLQLPLARTDTLHALKNIIEKVPCYFLELGPNVREVPEIIGNFLKQYEN